MKRSNKKKGFTLVELIVVIAILAILATVSIIAYLSFIKKANISNDISLTTQINTILEADEISGRPNTPSEANAVLKEMGIDLLRLSPATKDYSYIWNSETNRVILLDKEKNVVAPQGATYKPLKSFAVVHSESEISDKWAGFSVYLAPDFDTDTHILQVTGIGVDSYDNRKITEIRYIGNDQSNEVIVCTYGGKLTVDAANDDVKHYGWVNEVTITAVNSAHCYHEYGFMGKLTSFESGKFVAESGARFHEARITINAALSGKSLDLDNGEKYEVHFFVDGKCVICNEGECQHTWSEGVVTTAATCGKTGVMSFTCNKCGEEKTETIAATGAHTFRYTDNGGNHTKTCSVCGNSKNEAHNYVDGTCVCGATEVTVKNGLVDGYYYKDNERFTGTITDEDKEYTFENGMLVLDLTKKTYTKYEDSATVKLRIYDYTIDTSNKYLTNQIIIDGGNSSYCDSATIKITDNSGKNYGVQSVTGIKPFGGLLDKNGWTSSDVSNYLMNPNGASFISNGYVLSDANKLTMYYSDADDPDSYDMFVPKLCVDSTLVQNYFSLTGCSGVADYYTKYNNGSLMITLTDYMKLVYGKGYALSKDGDTVKYTMTYGDYYKSELVGSFYVYVSPDSETGLPWMYFASKNNGEYMGAPTQIVDGKLVFCDYVIDADGSTRCTNGNFLRMLEFYTGIKYYVSISDNTVVLYKDSVGGTECCKFIIDQDNNTIKTYLNGEITDPNGIPYRIPSSGSVGLAGGKISLTGVFDTSKAKIPDSAFGNLEGTSNSDYLIFEVELLEELLKYQYNNIKVQCNGGSIYALDAIPASVFAKTGDVLTASFENVNYGAITNILNGCDIAGLSYRIVLTVSE